MTTHERDELLNEIEGGWGKLQAFIAALSDEQLSVPAAAAGWTVKDHLIHLAVWESSAAALLRRQPRWEAMGIGQEMWDTRDVDQVNAAIQRQHKDRSLADVLGTLRGGHEQLVAQLQALADEDLRRTYAYYQPGYEGEAPIINWVRGNTFEHYADHIPWMRAIVEPA